MHIPACGPGETLIGLSIPVPQPWAGELQLARQNFGDPFAELIPPHVTIIGPTVVADAQVSRLEEFLADVAAGTSPFRLRLRGTGSFRPTTPVVFVNVVEGGDACAALAERCRQLWLDQPLRFPFHPHVTVAQDVPDPQLEQAERELAGFEAAFEVPALLLSQQVEGGLWWIRRRFLFGGDQ